MFILQLLFFLSIISISYNLYTGDMTDVLAASVFAIITGILYIFVKKQHKDSEKFMQFLFDNKTEIKYGHVTYQGNLITADTIVTQYVFCISFVIFSFKQRSSFVYKQGLMSFLLKLIYTFMTLTMGWWSIPSGPINTVKSIIKNLSGGYKYRVDDLITHLESKTK